MVRRVTKNRLVRRGLIIYCSLAWGHGLIIFFLKKTNKQTNKTKQNKTKTKTKLNKIKKKQKQKNKEKKTWQISSIVGLKYSASEFQVITAATTELGNKDDTSYIYVHTILTLRY